MCHDINDIAKVTSLQKKVLLKEYITYKNRINRNYQRKPQ